MNSSIVPRQNFRLGKNLKLLLIGRRYTTAQLARASGISPKTIYGWLAGRGTGDITQLKIVAEILEVSIDEICFSDDIMKSLDKTSPDALQVLPGVYEVVLRRIEPLHLPAGSSKQKP